MNVSEAILMSAIRTLLPGSCATGCAGPEPRGGHTKTPQPTDCVPASEGASAPPRSASAARLRATHRIPASVWAQRSFALMCSIVLKPLQPGSPLDSKQARTRPAYASEKTSQRPQPATASLSSSGSKGRALSCFTARVRAFATA